MFTQTSSTPHSQGRKSTGCPLELETPSTNSAGEQGTPPRCKRETTSPDIPSQGWEASLVLQLHLCWQLNHFSLCNSQKIQCFPRSQFSVPNTNSVICLKLVIQEIRLKNNPNKSAGIRLAVKIYGQNRSDEEQGADFSFQEKLTGKTTRTKNFGLTFLHLCPKSAFFGVQTIFMDDFHSILLNENSPTLRNK